MFRYSARKIVIAAAACFIGLAALQIAWIISAYDGTLALYSKAKKQFESELEADLEKQVSLKEGLKALVDDFEKYGRVSEMHQNWFHLHFVPQVELSPKTMKYSVYTDGIAIVRQEHGTPGQLNVQMLVTNYFGKPDASMLRNAGRLCLHCLFGNNETGTPADYQVLLFYKDPLPGFVESLWVLILGSLVLLIVLGLLFREILRKYRQEKRLSEAKNDFINNLTHEMQTPVFAIQMANRLIRDKTTGQKEISPLTDIIREEALQLKQHAARILDLATLEGGQIGLNQERTELNAFVADKKSSLEFLMQDKGQLEVHFHPGPLYAEIDRVHFNNVIMSLMDNAIKYSGPSPHIIIGTGQKNSRVFIRLQDRGVGIPKAYLPYVTDKFFRAPHVKRNGISGFGLGLSYVKSMVDLHGGEMEISSTEGQGTTVTILLPQAAQHA